jgi:uncharacterized protein YbbK (DUF523 family)
MSRPILVSACLLGLNTRYDGTTRRDERAIRWLAREGLIPVPVCPEQLAGLPTPRPPCQFAAGDGATLLDGGGRLLTAAGEDRGEIFRHGAAETLKAARLCGCQSALLKERSPSCGRHFVHRDGHVVPGQGVACALLLREGFDVRSEEDLAPETSGQ